LRKYLKFIVLCLLAALVLVWFVWNLDWAEAAGALRRADWRLVAVAVVIVWTTYLIRAFRWRALLKPLAPRASLREAFAATTVGFSAIFLAGRAGEVVRPVFLPLRDPEVSAGAAFVTIAVERIYDIVAVVILFAANLLVLRLPGVDAGAYARVREAGLVLLVGSLVGVGLLAWFRGHAAAVTSWLNKRLERLPGVVNRAGRAVTGLFEQLARTLGVLTDARALVVTVGWTAALWAAITLANLLVLRAFGFPLGVTETVFVLGWSLVGSLVPTPGGGAGTYHAATAYGLTAFLGVAESEAKAATIVLHLVVFGSSVFFGLYYFLRSGVGLARLRDLAARDEKEGEEETAPPQEGKRAPGEKPTPRVKLAGRT
jgi:uncharacterized protein (TIRG00374 family)